MSSVVPDLNNPNSVEKPQHRIHTADEPLPGARGVAPPPHSAAVENGVGAPQHDQFSADQHRQGAHSIPHDAAGSSVGSSPQHEHLADHHRQDGKAIAQNAAESGTGVPKHNQLFSAHHHQDGKTAPQNTTESGTTAPRRDQTFANHRSQDVSDVSQRLGEHSVGASQHNQHFADQRRQGAASLPQGNHGHTHPNNFGPGNAAHYPPVNVGGDAHSGLGHVPHPPDHSQHHTAAAGVGANSFPSERPQGVRPAEGGVAGGGKPNVHADGPNLVDKVVGKTEQVVGKAINDPGMHERGQLRATGGKSAATGLGRAAHD